MCADVLQRAHPASPLSSSQCSNIDGVCPLSCESADLNCFLVDNNGFILLSKERNEVNRRKVLRVISNLRVLRGCWENPQQTETKCDRRAACKHE
ncbi:hypothetical protein PAMP_020264 [Pampus punctatissimus]